MASDALIPEPLQGRAEATVERVIAATVELLDRSAEADVTLTAIADHSGISTGSLYHHFGSRDHAIVAAHARRFACLMQHQRALLGPALRASDALGVVSGIEALFAAGPGEGGGTGRAVAVSVLSAARHRSDLRQRIAEELATTARELASEIASAQGRGIIRADLQSDAVAVLIQLLMLMSGTAVATEPHLAAVEWAAVVRALVHALLVHDCPAACGLRLGDDVQQEGHHHAADADPAARFSRAALIHSDVDVAPPADEQALLEAVIETLDQHGPDAVVLRELCDRVGVSASWLHRRFGERRHLIDAARLELARQQSVREIAAFAELLEVGDDRVQLIRHLAELVRGIGAATSPVPHLERIDLVASALHDPGLLAAWIGITSQAIDRMTSSLEALQKRGSMRDDLSARSVGRLLWGMMTAGVVARFAQIDDRACAVLTEAVVEVLVGTGPDTRTV